MKHTENKQVTIIRVRRGINGFKYSACNENGYFIGNFEKLADVRRHWQREIRWGVVVLVRELDKMPDLSAQEAMRRAVHNYIIACTTKKTKRSYSNKKVQEGRTNA